MQLGLADRLPGARDCGDVLAHRAFYFRLLPLKREEPRLLGEPSGEQRSDRLALLTDQLKLGLLRGNFCVEPADLLLSRVRSSAGGFAASTARIRWKAPRAVTRPRHEPIACSTGASARPMMIEAPIMMPAVASCLITR